MSLGEVFVSETLGTAILILLGAGVVANVLLAKSKGKDGGFLLINFGWGIAVMAGVYVAYKSGAHLNPAVTLGVLASGADTYAPDVPITFGSTLVYFAGEFLGAFLGACAAFLAYRKQFEAEEDEGKKLAVFSTGPEVRSPLWNVVTEVIGTFVLVAWILLSPGAKVSVDGVPTFGNSALGYAGVAFVVLVIGTSLGGPTGYAINPARDLGPRIAYAFLMPIRNKGNANWGYSWVPVVGPMVGAALAALLFLVLPV